MDLCDVINQDIGPNVSDENGNCNFIVYNFMAHDTLFHAIKIMDKDINVLINMQKPKIKLLILYLPLTYYNNPKDMDLLLEKICKIKFEGKVILYDLINEHSQSWIRNLKSIPDLRINDVVTIEDKFFKIIWDKYIIIRPKRLYKNSTV